MRVLFFLLLLLGVGTSQASDFYFPASASSGGLAHASVGDANFWSTINNPSASSFLSQMQIGLNYESRFNLDELSVKTIAFVYPNKFGTVTSSFQYFGYEVYNEFRYSLGFARKFGSNFGASVQFCGLGSRINPEAPTLYAFTFDASVYAKLSERLSLGFYVFNLPNSQFKSTEQNVVIPILYRLGGEWMLSDKLNVLFESRGKNGEDPSFCGGVNYELLDGFEVSVGLGNNPYTVSAGLQYSKWGLTMGISCAVIRQIGKVWNCSVVYGF